MPMRPQLAKTWTAQNTAINEVSASARKFGMTEAIPDGNDELYTKTFEIDPSMSVEHVELGVDLRHERLGDLIIKLISPNGTVSTLMDRPTVNAERPFGLSGQDSGVPTHLLWDFSSVQFGVKMLQEHGLFKLKMCALKKRGPYGSLIAYLW